MAGNNDKRDPCGTSAPNQTYLNMFRGTRRITSLSWLFLSNIQQAENTSLNDTVPPNTVGPTQQLDFTELRGVPFR